MQIVDLSNVKDEQEYKTIKAGAYICTITDVVDVPLNTETNKGNYLRVFYDVAEGEFKGYYAQLRENKPEWKDWVGSYIRSYKEKALPMFKRFCSVVNKSNPGFVFDGKTNVDEKSLIGKKIGLVFQEEEYYGNNGNIKSKLVVNREFPIEDIEKQKTPEPKTLPKEKEDGFVNVPEGTPEELPF